PSSAKPRALKNCRALATASARLVRHGSARSQLTEGTAKADSSAAATIRPVVQSWPLTGAYAANASGSHAPAVLLGSGGALPAAAFDIPASGAKPRFRR